MTYKESTIKNFCKDFSLPIQIYSPEYLQFYINLYDSIFDTKTKWDMFTETVNQFESEDAFNAYKHNLIAEIVDEIKNCTAYKNFSNFLFMDKVFPIGAGVQGVQYTKSTKLYSPQNNNKYFISIDLTKANYQALKRFNPEIVDNTATYEDFIHKFTDMKYFCKSKILRQIIFGNLDMNKIAHIEKWLITNVLKYLLQNNIYSADNIITFTADEIIIQCDETHMLNSSAINDLKKGITNTTGAVASIDAFKLLYIGNNGYVKIHKDSPPVFKGIPPAYFPQAYCAYMGIPLPDMATHFSYEGQIAKFLTPMKWENI